MNKAKIIITQTPSVPPTINFIFTCSCCGNAFDATSYASLKNTYHSHPYCPFCWADFTGIINETDIGFDDSYVTGEPD